MKSRDGRSILYDLADKQDKFEHDHSSELATRVGLFLVFAGFISGVALELLKVILSTDSTGGTLRPMSIVFLGASGLLLFAAMFILLRAAIFAGYSAPAAVSEYVKKYKELCESHKGNVEAANDELQDWILDATAEAVDKNVKQNSKRARLLVTASQLVLCSTGFLLVALLLTVPQLTHPRVPANPSATASSKQLSSEVSNGKGTKSEKGETGSKKEDSRRDAK